MKTTIRNLVLYGKCPIDYGEVRYVGMGRVFKCKSCGAKLEAIHVLRGANSLQTVNRMDNIFKEVTK